MKVFSSFFALGSLVASVVGDSSPTRGQPTNPDIVVYVEDWAVYARGFDLSNFEKNTLQRDLPYNRLFLNYAFWQINPQTCRLENLDNWAFMEKESNNSGEFPPKQWDDVKGQWAGIRHIQERYPRVYAMPSVGGWSRSHGFVDCVRPGKREALIKHIVEVLEFYKWDGIDFDWEYPGCDMSEPCGCQKEEVCTVNPNTQQPRDTQNRSTKEDWPIWKDFLRLVRKELDALAPRIGKDRMMLSAAVGMSPRILLGNGGTSPLPTPVDFFCNEDTMDFVNLMTYDYFGAWSPQVGHLAPLYDTPGVSVDDQMNIDFGVKQYLKQCKYPEKLNLGLATYGKAWRNVPRGTGAVPGAWQTAQVNGGYPSIEGTIEPGTISAFHALGTLRKDPNCQYAWDDMAKVSTLYCSTLNGHKDVFVSYEDGRTWEEKMKYARQNGLRGAIIWAASDMGNGKTSQSPKWGGDIPSPDVGTELWQGLFDGYMGKGAVTVNPAGHLGRGQFSTNMKLTGFTGKASSCPLDCETPAERCTSGQALTPPTIVQAHRGNIQGKGGIVFGGQSSVTPPVPTPAPTLPPYVPPPTTAPVYVPPPTTAPVYVPPPTTAPVYVPPATNAPTPSGNAPAECKARLASSNPAWKTDCDSTCDYFNNSPWCPGATTGAALAQCVNKAKPYCNLV